MANIAPFTGTPVNRYSDLRLETAFDTAFHRTSYHVSGSLGSETHCGIVPGELSDGISETHCGLDPEEWGCPVKRNLRAFLTSDCAQAYHVFGEVKDGLSETRRGLVPEGEDSDGRQGEDIGQSPTGAIDLHPTRWEAEDNPWYPRNTLPRDYRHGFSESLGGHRRHQTPNFWTFFTRDSPLVTFSTA
ncbi:hypothetical protein PENSOL_c059G01570 [Penicillium solitum]|uniref:Uncharacterized protein n=1 Tax=Penicillium solitum TaxID=60172 RepID=A0A1V6QM45_9EURO|nr:uncharacterized protein PENSOL_c059G01570 [Penicillium solitum]OQD90283.1 hypothetical protein PENSOL_c059G01570 [Penicillium solitum]